MNRHAGSGEDNLATGRLYPVRIASLIFIFAASLIVLFALAMLYVGARSSQEADRQAYENDIELFENTLNSRFTLLARDQYSLSAWNRHLARLNQVQDPDRILAAMVDSLWYQFGHDRTLLIGPAGQVLAYARKGAIERNPAAITLDADLTLLVDKARARYRGNPAAPENGGGAVFEAAFQTIEGEPALLSAMALAPADPTQDAAVLVSVKFIDGDLLEYLNAQLSFNALHFNTNPPPNLPATHKTITSLSGQRLGAFIWADNYPGAEIWSVIWPLVLLIGALMAVGALMVARQIAGMANVVERSERRTRHMARHDALTGLANRLRFGEELMAAIACADAVPFAVIACDLDRFKAVNDTHGHAAGDKVLRDVAQRMTEVVAEAGLVSRTGGDEFIILMLGYADTRRLRELGERLIATVCAPITLEDGTVTDVGVSLGIAQSHVSQAQHGGDTAASIMRAADEALYEAKATGRARVVFARDRLLRQPAELPPDPPTAAAQDAAVPGLSAH